MIETYILDSYDDMVNALKNEAILITTTTKLKDIKDLYDNDEDIKKHLDYNGNQALHKVGKTYYLFETKKKVK